MFCQKFDSHHSRNLLFSFSKCSAKKFDSHHSRILLFSFSKCSAKNLVLIIPEFFSSLFQNVLPKIWFSLFYKSSLLFFKMFFKKFGSHYSINLHFSFWNVLPKIWFHFSINLLQIVFLKNICIFKWIFIFRKKILSVKYAIVISVQNYYRINNNNQLLC